jgi:hypothetical protein
LEDSGALVVIELSDSMVIVPGSLPLNGLTLKKTFMLLLLWSSACDDLTRLSNTLESFLTGMLWCGKSSPRGNSAVMLATSTVSFSSKEVSILDISTAVCSNESEVKLECSMNKSFLSTVI